MLKKPVIALILCVIIVISSTVISVHHDLDPRCDSVREGFSEISDQLVTVCTASDGIIKLAEKYEIDEFVTFEAGDLCSSMRFSIGDDDPAELSSLYRMLLTQVDSIRTSLKLKGLSDEDAKLYNDFESDYLSAQKRISESDYNEDVSSCLKNLGFFSRSMARLCGVRLPEQFA